MSLDRYPKDRVDSPATWGVTVTPSDSEPLPFVTKCLRVGGAGDLTVKMRDGSTLLIESVAAGEWLPVRVCRVMQTGTTATKITAFG